MKIRYIIVDSHMDSSENLRSALEYYHQFEECGIIRNLVDAEEYLASNSIDAVFMNREEGDPTRTGDASFMCSYWSRQYPDMLTILYGDPSYAYHASLFGCTAYLDRCFHAGELQQLLGRIQYRMELLEYKHRCQNRILMIRCKDGYKLVERDDILFVERTGRRNRMLTKSGREIFLVGYTMDELEKLLSGCGFYRCYQSFIVNLENVTQIVVDNEKKFHTLRFEGYDGQVVISRERYGDILAELKEKYTRISL